MHLWEALPHVVLRTALPHCAEPEPLGRVVELRGGQRGLAEPFASHHIWYFSPSVPTVSQKSSAFMDLPPHVFSCRQLPIPQEKSGKT